MGPGLANLWEKPRRSVAIMLAAMLGIVVIAFLTLVLSGRAAVLILDYPSRHFFYPVTIQNLMHIVFFVGLGDIFVRWRTAVREQDFLGAQFLPEDDRTVLISRDLGPIRRRVANLFDRDSGFLPSLINLAILQFQSSSSVEQAAGVMSQQLELMSHRVETRYGLVRFIAWAVPTLGFIGTVYSLGASLSAAGDPTQGARSSRRRKNPRRRIRLHNGGVSGKRDPGFPASSGPRTGRIGAQWSGRLYVAQFD